VLIGAKTLAEKEFVKQQQANFIAVSLSSLIWEARDKFHYNFKAILQAHFLDIGVWILVQWKMQKQT